MAEGGIVETSFEGGEAEQSETEILGGAADPIAAAIAIDAARFDPELSCKAGQYLEAQSLLTAIQTEHLHEQRAVQLSHLKLRRWSERMRLGLQLFVGMIGTVIGLGVLTMLYDAFTSKNVVVEAFQAPPALAGRGLNGTVVATQVLDGLQKLQNATRGPSRGLTTRGAWTSDIKIEVPETGISIGEIDRLLHERFGQDVHVDGDLIQTPAGGLALTIRGDGVPAKTFAGGIDDLDKLTTQASEYVYGRSQPWLYAVYLISVGRYQDVVDFMPGAFPRASEGERPNLANAWGVALQSLNRYREAIEKYRLEMALSPPHSDNWWKGWGNMIGPLQTTEGEEAAWRESTRYLQENDNAPPAEKAELRLLFAAATVVTDLPLVLEAFKADAAHNGGAGASSLPDGPVIADTYALMHDPASAEHYMAISDPDDPSKKLEADLLQACAALERGDAAAAVAPLEDLYKAWLADPNLRGSSYDAPCFLGLAYGLTGRMRKADAVFQRTGSWSRCYAFRGDVLIHAGDNEAASRIWAEGLKLAPDMPWIYLHRGLVELSRGDLHAAQADFATAHAKSPHFADPFKAWGDTLARAGRWKEALAKYDEALKYAPAWAELQTARSMAVKRSAA